ncbi:MAG: M23 family metallopeptidase [Actinomycetota bacterium]|nr:M23 family metallopeptidase [Actinomycetota bacterium]
MPSHRQDSRRNSGRHRSGAAARPSAPASGRHRVAPPPKSRYAAVATTAILGAGVVALGTAAAIPSTPAPVAAASTRSLVFAGVGGSPSMGDGVVALHGTVSRDAPGLMSTRASRSTVRYPLAFRPVKGGTLTSCFCWRWGAFHDGIDIAAPMFTPIYAAAAGVVESAGPEPGYGNLIVIRHDAHTITFYGHEERILVKPGQQVHAGQVIALVGNRGFSTGPHLHFGLHIDNAPVDPIPWLARRGVKI